MRFRLEIANLNHLFLFRAVTEARGFSRTVESVAPYLTCPSVTFYKSLRKGDTLVIKRAHVGFQGPYRVLRKWKTVFYWCADKMSKVVKHLRSLLRACRAIFLFSDRMTALEEIKEVATASADSALRTASTMVRSADPNQRVLREFRGRLEDMRAELRAFYKFAVLQAKQRDNAQEVTAIWREVLYFCDGVLNAWQHLRRFDASTQGAIDDYRTSVEQLKAAALSHFQFHNGRE